MSVSGTVQDGHVCRTTQAANSALVKVVDMRRKVIGHNETHLRRGEAHAERGCSSGPGGSGARQGVLRDCRLGGGGLGGHAAGHPAARTCKLTKIDVCQACVFHLCRVWQTVNQVKRWQDSTV